MAELEPLELRVDDRVLYARTEAETDHAVAEIEHDLQNAQDYGHVLGLDTEWKAFCDPPNEQTLLPVSEMKIDVLQIGTLRVVAVVHLHAIGFVPGSLARLLGGPCIKVGAGVMFDAAMLEQSYEHRGLAAGGISGGTAIPRLIDLNAMRDEVAATTNDTSLGLNWKTSSFWKLQTLLAKLTYKDLPKPAVRTGDWRQVPLSEDQLHYAALDVVASVRVYDALVMRLECSEKDVEELLSALRQKDADRKHGSVVKPPYPPCAREGLPALPPLPTPDEAASNPQDEAASNPQWFDAAVARLEAGLIGVPRSSALPEEAEDPVPKGKESDDTPEGDGSRLAEQGGLNKGSGESTAGAPGPSGVPPPRPLAKRAASPSVFPAGCQSIGGSAGAKHFKTS